MTDVVIISDASDEDVREVVEVHLHSFPKFFLSKLGPRFLKAYYRQVLDYEKAYFLVARKNGSLVGFVAGFQDPQRFYKTVLWNALNFVGPLIISVATCPRIVLLLVPKLSSLFNRCRFKKCNDSMTCQKKVELSSLAVCPTAQREGLGGKLVREFITSCSIDAPVIIYLTTDAVSNEGVNQFYSNLGFTRQGVVHLESRRVMNRYELFINDTTASFNETHTPK